MRSLLLATVAALSLAACDKPTEADCTKAVKNLNKLHDVTMEPNQESAAVRKCQSSSQKSSVTCMIAATTVEQANACK